MNEERGSRSFLVTGATGFIGASLTRALVNQFGPAAVTVLVHPRQRPGEADALAEFCRMKLRIIECDVLDLPKFKPGVPPFDVVFHLAAAAEPENPLADFSVNDTGTRHVLNWLAPAMRSKRFVFTSTLACVDRGPALGWITESTPCTPITPYGRTKLRAEEEIRGRRSELGYDFTILRLCTIIGPGFRPTGMFGVCPKLLARRAFSARLNWPGRSSFMGLGDLVRVLIELSVQPKAANETLVLSNGENPTFDDVLTLIAGVLNLPRRRVTLPGWLWRLLGALIRPMARCPLVPAGSRVQFWRAANVIDDGICADAARLNSLRSGRYQSVQEALRDAYGR